ncbi:hypothetical protein KIN20_011492 [Parelaphostrongylus tenuis]|uniref:Uncharacterized protein n=1 Tax=Parelaphostrongylus tenuis TaxID=148309 RepID=A0AAD5MCY5_PARTN|nr:hypothetical protein KIN20_011492 [Parelaphostrongylus tenuis]
MNDLRKIVMCYMSRREADDECDSVDANLTEYSSERSGLGIVNDNIPRRCIIVGNKGAEICSHVMNQTEICTAPQR